jgi:hypothetical protein
MGANPASSVAQNKAVRITLGRGAHTCVEVGLAEGALDRELGWTEVGVDTLGYPEAGTIAEVSLREKGRE